MTDVNGLLTIVVLGLACATMSVTVARSHMFLWFRAMFLNRPLLLKLVSCHYCMGHWFAAFLVLVAAPWDGGDLVGLAVVWLAVTALSGIFSQMIVRE